MKVLRVYHAGRDATHRERERALVRAGVDLVLVVPRRWPGPDDLHHEPFDVVEAETLRTGDVNRHVYADPDSIRRLVASYQPDIVDLHEEPFSSAMHQILRRLPADQPVVGYTAQNIDKRFPPPFWIWERQALARLNGLYPCSRQAASVAVGKGFRGPVSVLPLAASSTMTPGSQEAPSNTINLLLVGRLVPEKGILDAVRVLAGLKDLDVRLHLVGAGPQATTAHALATRAGVADRLRISGWQGAVDLARCYHEAHVLLAPSRSTATWAEQFGRMVVEAQACGAVVVGYASGALPEVVGNAGVLVREGDPDALSASVRTLATNPQRWTRLRERGLQAARDRTWDTVAHGQLTLYEQARHETSQGRSRPQRRTAVTLWGPPAELTGAQRPIAVPRYSTALSREVRRVAKALGQSRDGS